MRALTREIARGLAGTVQRVEVPAHDAVVYIRPVNAAAIVRWAGMPDGAAANAELVALSVCDEEGAPFFYLEQAVRPELSLEEAVREVGEWPSTLFYPVFNAALALNGMSGSQGHDAGN